MDSYQSSSPFCKNNPFPLPASAYYQAGIPSSVFFSSKPISKYSQNKHTISDSIKYQNLIINRMLKQRSKALSDYEVNIVDRQIQEIEKNTKAYGSNYFDLHQKKDNPFLKKNIFEKKLEEVKYKSKITKNRQQNLLLWKPHYQQSNEQTIWSQNQIAQLYRQLKKSDPLKSYTQSELNKQMELDLTKNLQTNKRSSMTFNMPGSKILNNSDNFGQPLQPQEIVDAFKSMFMKRKQSVASVHIPQEQNFDTQNQYIAKLLHHVEKQSPKKQNNQKQRANIKKKVEEDWERMMQQYEQKQHQPEDKFDQMMRNYEVNSKKKPQKHQQQQYEQDNYQKMMRKYDNQIKKRSKTEANQFRQGKDQNKWLNMLANYENNERAQTKFDNLDTFRSPQSNKQQTFEIPIEGPELDIWKTQNNSQQKMQQVKQSYQQLIKQNPGIPPLKKNKFRQYSSTLEQTQRKKMNQSPRFNHNQQIINKLLPTVDEQNENPWVKSPQQNEYNLDAWDQADQYPDFLEWENRIYERII